MPPHDPAEPRLVIGLGASAGGLEALEDFFAAAPVAEGFAYVVVQHLSPDFKSLMEEILHRFTSLRILRVDDGMRLERDTIYLIPPINDVLLEGLTLRLVDRGERGKPPMIIDHFFQSLAGNFGGRAVAVVLSGTGSDGSRGVAAVAKSGGLVVVQSPQEAKFDGMPKSAIKSGAAHQVLTAAMIPRAITRYALDPEGGREPLPCEGDEAHLDDMEAIYGMIKSTFGVDFSVYKPNTIKRRIERRTKISRQVTLPEYRRILLEDPEELDVLYQDLLIGVTHFFRDPAAFAALDTQVFPAIFEQLGAGETLRVWVPGCASGEEVYTLAIMIDEWARANGRAGQDFKLFATDIHRGSLARASAAVYEEDAIKMPDVRRDRYFTRVNSGYQVAKELRDRVVVATHNVLEDPPFTRIHLVSCRNLLIYFSQEAQKRVMDLFGYALNMGGFLFLGNSESVQEKSSPFTVVDPKLKIFRKDAQKPFLTSFRTPSRMASPERADSRLPQSRDWTDVLEHLLTSFVPTGFLVNDFYEVIYSLGNARRYLRLPEGRPSSRLPEMLPEALNLPLAGALRRALNDNRRVRYGGIELPDEFGGRNAMVNLTVQPVAVSRGERRFCFVMIEEIEHLGCGDETELGDRTQKGQTELARLRIRELEVDLDLAREGQQMVVEELETSNEELQATNEELIASNEELQSTNEELQSVNEELYTVNAEYDAKNRELAAVNNDLLNFLESTRIGTIFLDGNFNIRRFTSKAAEAMNLLPSDVGRPISHITTELNVRPGMLIDLAHQALDRGEPVEIEISSTSDRSYLLRVLPFVKTTGETEGVVINFIEVTEMRKLEKEREAASLRFRLLVENTEGVYLRWDSDGNVRFRSPSWEGYTGQSWEQYRAKGWKSALESGDCADRIRTERARAVADGADRFKAICKVWNSDSRAHRTCIFRASRFNVGSEEGWVVLVVDIEEEERERREALAREEMMHLITEKTKTAIYFKDLHGRYLMANPFAALISGKSEPQSIIGLHDSELFPPDTAAGIIESDQAVITGDQTVNRSETFHFGGEIHHFLTTKIPLHDDHGRVYALAGIATDVTQHMRTEATIKAQATVAEQKEQLERVNLELEDKNQQLGEFAYMASHDLKQPLRIIANYVDLLREEEQGLGSAGKDYVKRIADAANRMRELVDAILEYSRCGRQAMQKTTVPVGIIVAEVLAAYRDEIRQKRIEVETGELGEVEADRQMVYQIFLNLIGNSVKFSTEHPLIRILRRDEASGPRFEVEDNGIGIPEEYRLKVFEPFERLHSREEYPGTGVGLSVARRMVERHGGRVTLESAPGRGTTISFTLAPPFHRIT